MIRPLRAVPLLALAAAVILSLVADRFTLPIVVVAVVTLLILAAVEGDY